jgi:hypothetical protein
VFPSARIVFLVRDGRSVLRSNRQIARKGVGLSRIYRRALSTPLSEWAAYAPRAVGAIRRRTVGGPPPYWGPRPPGWKRILREHPEPVALAKIWASTITYAADDLQRCWSGEVFWVRYEDLVVDPRSQAGAMLDHLGIENPEPILRFLESSADPSRATKWRRELTDETLGLVEPAMRPTLERFGYTW